MLKDFSNVKWIMQRECIWRNPAAWPWNRGIPAEWAQFMVVRIVALVSFFFTLGKYLLTNLVFIAGFTGAWNCSSFFTSSIHTCTANLHCHFISAHVCILEFGEILKDSICIASIGWITYSLYQIFVKHQKLYCSVPFTCWCSVIFMDHQTLYTGFYVMPFFFLIPHPYQWAGKQQTGETGACTYWSSGPCWFFQRSWIPWKRNGTVCVKNLPTKT